MAAILGNAVFNDRSNNTDSVVGNGSFNGKSKNQGALGGDATFNGDALNEGTVAGNGLFKDRSMNAGIVSGNGTFKDQSTDAGSVFGESVFDDLSSRKMMLFDPPLKCHWFTESNSSGSKRRRIICGGWRNPGQITFSMWGGAWQPCPSTGCFTAPATYRPFATTNYVLDYEIFPQYEQE